MYVMLDKSSGLPLHYQIYQDLLAKINSGTYPPNAKLPSETELQEMYAVSRITVRGAMHELERAGYIKKYRGIGTIVSEPKHEYNLQQLTSFSVDSILYGEVSGSVLLKFELVVPEPHVVQELQLAAGEKAYYIERTRLRGNMVIGLHKAYIRCIDNIHLASEDFTEKASLYEMLFNQGLRLAEAVETLEAISTTAELAKVLHIKKNAPILYKERTTFDQSGIACEFVKIYYRADSYKYRAKLELNKG